MLRTDLAQTDITPAENVPLLGYGDRTHDSTGVHDPLLATAWYLHPDGAAPLCWLVLDLCLLGTEAVADLSAELARRTGLEAGRILISTTHTHSGPDVRTVHDDPRPWAARYRELLLQRSAEAIVRARQSSFEGRIEVREGACRLGTNRRGAGKPVDPRVIVLSLVDETGSLRGLLFHYSCHLTVLGVDNYQISADWIAPVRRDLFSTPAPGSAGPRAAVPIAFLQGAEGNIDPVCRGVLDMADPDQAAGSTFEVMEQMGDKMIQALRGALSSPPLARLETVRLKRAEVELPLRHGALSRARVDERVRLWRRELGRFLGVPADEVPEGMDINARVKERCRELGLGPEETLKRVADQFAYTAFLWIYRGGGRTVSPARGTARVALTLLDFGPLVFLGVPAEALVEIALEWQRRHPGRIALVAGLFGGWTGYLPHADNFREPDAGKLYETVSTLYSEAAAGRMLDAASGTRSSAGD